MRSDCRDISNFVATKTLKANLEDNNSNCRDNATTKPEDKQGCCNVATMYLVSLH